MPRKESLIPADWFAKADLDLQTADLLWREKGHSEIIGFHLHQGIEKYLKGFLLSRGWKLKRIHDLVALLNEAVQYNPSLELYRDTCQQVTEFYIEERYPFLISSTITREAIEPLIASTSDLVARLRRSAQQKS